MACSTTTRKLTFSKFTNNYQKKVIISAPEVRGSLGFSLATLHRTVSLCHKKVALTILCGVYLSTCCYNVVTVQTTTYHATISRYWLTMLTTIDASILLVRLTNEMFSTQM